MSIQPRLRRFGAADEGASLLLALIFIFLVGVVITALLPYAQAGITEASVARDVRTTQNAADGAVAGAIEQLRHDVTLGTGGACPSYTAPAYPDPIKAGNFVNLTVTCVQAPGSFPTASDVPPYAVITTGGGIRASGNNTLSIDGGVYASGAIDTTGGSQTKYAVIGRVFTTSGACSMVMSSVGIVDCPASGTDPAFPAVDYPSALGETAADIATNLAALPADPLGVCPNGKNYVQFQPGYYSQIPTPDPSTCGNNPPSTYWFAPCADPTSGCVNTTPGVYYLDFADATYAKYSNQAFWDLNQKNITLIGGSLKSTWPTAAPGHRCDLTKVGVQVILAGPSQISTGNGSELELCASQTSATTKQRVALYGVSQSDNYGVGATGGARTAVSTEVVPLTAANTPAAANESNWTNPDGARKIGDLEADNVTPNVATATFTGNKTFGVDLTDYGTAVGTPLVPDGSLVTSAVLHIRHFELVTGGHIDPQVTVTYADGSTDRCQLPGLASLGDRNIDLMTDCDNNLMASAAFRWKLLHDPNATPQKFLSVRYEAVGSKQGSTAASGKATVDGVQFKISYVAPRWDAERCQSGEAACFAYSNSNSDASDNTFFIGTVYTADSPMNVVVHNNPETIFQRGVIVKSLLVKASASSKQTDSPFQLPHSSAVDRTVLFTATLTGDTKKYLQARVHYVDCTPSPSCADPLHLNDEGNQLYPGREVDVIDWTTFH